MTRPNGKFKKKKPQHDNIVLECFICALDPRRCGQPRVKRPSTLGWNHRCTSHGPVALVEGRGLIPHPLEQLLKLLLQLVHHGLDVGLHFLSELSGQWLHLGPDGPVGGRGWSETCHCCSWG